MNITILDSKLAGLNAIVAKANASEGAEQTTAQAYLSARVAEMLASYDAQLIAAAKIQYDDIVTLAATLPDDKRSELIAFVQQLAG